MQTYIGTKQVAATPMNRQAYNDYCGWELPKDEDGADDGYLVEYLDGGKPNDSRHAGYISWSPKAQFDAAYVAVQDTAGLPPHMVRVAGELASLADKITKLGAFTEGSIFAKLDEKNRSLMLTQLAHMRGYADVLMQRLSA